MLFRRFGVAAELILVLLLGCISFTLRLSQVLLGSREVRVLLRVDVFHRPQREQDATADQSRTQHTGENHFSFHESYSPGLDLGNMQVRATRLT